MALANYLALPFVTYGYPGSCVIQEAFSLFSLLWTYTNYLNTPTTFHEFSVLCITESLFKFNNPSFCWRCLHSPAFCPQIAPDKQSPLSFKSPLIQPGPRSSNQDAQLVFSVCQDNIKDDSSLFLTWTTSQQLLSKKLWLSVHKQGDNLKPWSTGPIYLVWLPWSTSPIYLADGGARKPLGWVGSWEETNASGQINVLTHKICCRCHLCCSC